MTKPRMTQAMLRPDYKEFSRLAGEATLVPVVKSVAADLLTPVSAFLAIASDEPDAFLLESVERGEQIGRYTFLGARPYMQVRARGGDIELRRGKKKEERQGNAIQVIKELLRQHRPATVPGLPPFTAGAVGYFAYDAVRQLENIRARPMTRPRRTLRSSKRSWLRDFGRRTGARPRGRPGAN